MKDQGSQEIPSSQTVLWCDADIGGLKDIGLGEGRLTEGQLKEVLRRYNLRDGLIVLGRASNLVFNDKSINSMGKAASRDPGTGVIVSQFGLAYLASALISSGANDYKSKQIGDKQNLLTLLNIYSNDLASPELRRDPNAPLTHRDMAPLMVRMYAEQFEYQFNYVNLIARNIIIYNEIINLVPPQKFDALNVIFEKETGLTFPDYFVLSFATWAVSQKTATFRKDVLYGSQIPTMQEALTDEKVTNFLNILSVDYSTFRKEDLDANVNLDPVFTKYRFNPLLVYPIIKTDKEAIDPYVIPNTLAFLKKSFGGLYWWFHRHFEATGHQQDFRNYFGGVFEQYVGRILKQAYGEKNVHPEITYPKGKFVDWWVECNSTIYLFEAKAYQFALPTKQTGDNALLIKEVKTKIVQSIEQVFNRMSEINNYSELAFFRDKKIVPVIVFLEIPLASGHLYRELIDDELKELEAKGETGIRDAKIHLLNIEELELFDCAVNKIPLEDVFGKYEKNIAEGFLSVIQNELGEPPRNKYLDKVFNDFMIQMTADKHYDRHEASAEE